MDDDEHMATLVGSGRPRFCKNVDRFGAKFLGAECRQSKCGWIHTCRQRNTMYITGLSNDYVWTVTRTTLIATTDTKGP